MIFIYSMLAEYIKQKPNCGPAKLKEVVENFRKSMDTCCTAVDQQACLDKAVRYVTIVQCI